jgi:naphthalene 1,2-dioxygenase ferredoxin component
MAACGRRWSRQSQPTLTLTRNTHFMFVKVTDDKDLGEGEIKGFDVNGNDIVMARVKGELFAVDGICTHLLAYLSDGELDGFEILCPLHGGAFDLRNGAPTREPCSEPLRSYPVRVEDGAILVDLD